jgi:hypothetical protein
MLTSPATMLKTAVVTTLRRLSFRSLECKRQTLDGQDTKMGQSEDAHEQHKVAAIKRECSVKQFSSTEWS